MFRLWQLTRPHGFLILSLLWMPCTVVGGTITFTGDSALTAALGGTIATGVKTIAVGQTVTLPFNATIQGVESVSGSIVLSATSNGGSIQLSNVVFTVLSPTTAELTFGVTVKQAFAYSGPDLLQLDQDWSGSSRITQPGTAIQPGGVLTAAKVTAQSWIWPDSGNTSSGFIPSTSTNVAGPSDSFPAVQDFDTHPWITTGINRTTSRPVTLSYIYGTSISTFNSWTGANTSTTLRSGSAGFEGVASVPEPPGALMLAGGMALVAAWRARRNR